MATNRFFDNSGLTVTDGTLAKASQLNTFVSETNKAFEVVESENDVIQAQQNLANKWAEEDQGVEVDPIAFPNEYSARAYALEAMAWASGTGGVSTKADGTTITYSAQEKAVAAAASAAGALASETICTDAETAAEAAQTAAETAQGLAETAQGLAETAQTGAETAETNAGTSETNAGTSETNAQLRAWEATAEAMTAESYATEAEDVFVNIYTSDGDGTYTATPTTEYSAKHHAIKALASATPPAVGSSSFTGDGNTTTVAHGLPGAPSGVTVTAAADPNGYLGEIWVTWDATNIYVGNSGSFTGAFTYVAYR